MVNGLPKPVWPARCQAGAAFPEVGPARAPEPTATPNVTNEDPGGPSSPPLHVSVQRPGASDTDDYSGCTTVASSRHLDFWEIMHNATPPPGFLTYPEFIHAAMMNAPAEILAEMAAESDDEDDHA